MEGTSPYGKLCEYLEGEDREGDFVEGPAKIDESGQGEVTTAADLEGKLRKKKKRKALGICLSHCKYDSVRRVSKQFGMKEVSEDDDWSLLWMDTTPSGDRVADMKKYQKINHFPGMQEICRKDSLARNLNRMMKAFPKEYNIFPPSWVLPADYGDFAAFCRQKKTKTYITKPESGCQGKGIMITKNPARDIKPGDHCVVQQYLTKPFLIDDFKWDLRIYVLITSCDPLRVFVYKDGLARFCTLKYSDPMSGNLDETCMHLTNYAINKNSENFVRDDDCGSKRRITTVNRWFEENGYDVKKIWADIEDVIIKTFITAHPIIRHSYRATFSNHGRTSACFEVLGFDIMLDKKLKPWLLEVNLSPSFHTDAPLDKEVKEGLLADCLELVNMYACDKRKCQEEGRRRAMERLLQRGKTKECKQDDAQEQAEYERWLTEFEDAHLGGYRRIYPQNGNEAQYIKYFDSCGSLFTETAASKARQECARLQREELAAKQREAEMFRSRLQRGPVRPAARPMKDESQDACVPRPESPTLPRAESADGRLAARRSTSQRLSRPVSQASTRRSVSAMQLRPPPLEDTSVSQPIDLVDEQVRLRRMQERSELVRSLGIPELCRMLLIKNGSPRVTLDPPGATQTVFASHNAALVSTRPPLPPTHQAAAMTARKHSQVHKVDTYQQTQTLGLYSDRLAAADMQRVAMMHCPQGGEGATAGLLNRSTAQAVPRLMSTRSGHPSSYPMRVGAPRSTMRRGSTWYDGEEEKASHMPSQSKSGMNQSNNSLQIQDGRAASWPRVNDPTRLGSGFSQHYIASSVPQQEVPRLLVAVSRPQNPMSFHLGYHGSFEPPPLTVSGLAIQSQPLPIAGRQHWQVECLSQNRLGGVMAGTVSSHSIGHVHSHGGPNTTVAGVRVGHSRH